MLKRIIQEIRSIISTKAVDKWNEEDREASLSTLPSCHSELLRANIEISDIPDIFNSLLSSNRRVRLLAAEKLNHTMTNLTCDKFIRVSEAYRERSSIEWRCDWRRQNPKDLLDPVMSEEEKATILGLCTFHPNGYFREKAVLALSEMKNGGEIPYLLIRVNDWVMQVRSLAREKLLACVKPEYAMSFVNNISLVLRLEECSRDQHRDIINGIITTLCSAEGLQSLISGLRSQDSKVRLGCYKVIIRTKALDSKGIISYLVEDKNPYNRLFVIRGLQGEISSGEFKDIVTLLIKDRLPQIRVLALEKLCEFQREAAEDILKNNIFDRARSVRETARYLLAKYKAYDFAAIYREAIKDNENVITSIYGLGETGSSGDAKYICGFLNSPEAGIVKAAVTALANLDIVMYKEDIISKLSDERPGISKAARRALGKAIHSGDQDTLYKVHSEAAIEHVKINTCILLCSLSKWDAISYIIEFCASSNEKVSTLGQRAIERWKLRYNYSFTAPKESQVEAIRRSLSDFGKGIKDEHREFIEFSIRDFMK